MTHLRLLMCTIVLTAACGGPPDARSPAASEAVAPSASAPGSEAPPATFGDQVALGQKLYGENCAGCHGAGGEGKDAPAVVGLDKGALPLAPPAGAKVRKVQFKTVADIAGFVVKNMPPRDPGKLSEEEYYAILAFDLKANGIELDKKLDGALAATLEVPRK